MALDPALYTRIDGLVRSHRVVLFMKGDRRTPRCGFSATAARALDAMIDDYVTVDVLADEAIRQGIKEYGNWPTIPQLYIDGELIGGSDIISQMVDSGQLQQMLGLPPPDRTPPAITISDAAARAIGAAMADAGDAVLHLAIDATFRAELMLKPPTGREIVSEANGIAVHFDLASAQRARGLHIDWVEGAQGAGLAIRNPNAPAPVKSMSVEALRDALAAGQITVVDVRPPADRARAPFAPAVARDEAAMARLGALPKDTPLAFLCHHGKSSRSAAEHFRSLGFRDLSNVEGGIDAWSQRIDPSVPRY